MMAFEYLPPEIQLGIFSYLDQNDLCVASKVSDYWRDVAADPHLWKRVIICDCTMLPRDVVKIVEHCYLLEELVFGGVTYWNWVRQSPELKFLRKLNFCLCKIDADVISTMVDQFPLIERVEITDVKYDDELVEKIMQWENLQNLNITIDFERFDGTDAITHLAKYCNENCASIKAVNLYFHGFMGDNEFSSFSAIRGSNVNGITLDCYSFVTKTSFESLKQYSSLTSLRLFNTEFMYDVDLMNIRAITSLQELHISTKSNRKQHITPVGFENLFKDVVFPNLTAIHFKSCDINNAGLKNLTESCPNLKTLELWRCQKISSEGLGSIGTNCRQLENLYLVGLRNVKSSAIKRLPQVLEKLTRLHVNYCRKISSFDLAQIRSENPRLLFDDQRLNLPRRNEFQIRF